MEGGGKHKKCQTIIMLLLCSIALSLTCFILHGLTKIVPQGKEIAEAATLEVMKGSILINGKELDFQLESVSASESNGLLLSDVTQSDRTEIVDMAEKAVWKHLNFSVDCGHDTMKLIVIGASAAELQLDVGSAHHLPLNQVPEACGYSVTLNAQGLVLVVPYYGCNVKQENGRYVLPLSWRETAVTFICTRLQSLDKTPVLKTTETVAQSAGIPLPRHPWSLHRSKRQLRWPHVRHYPWYPEYPCYPCPEVTPAPTTTTKPTLWNPRIDPSLLHRLLAHQPIHNHDVQRPLNDYVYKHLAQQLLSQILERSDSHEVLQHIFGKYLLSKIKTPTNFERRPKLNTQRRWQHGPFSQAASFDGFF